MKRNQRIFLMVAMSLLITVLIGINARQTIYRLIEMNSWVVHTYQVLNKTQHVESLLITMDNDLRSYILSENAYFQADFGRKSREMNRQLKSIHSLTVDSPEQARRLKLLDTLFQRKLIQSRSLFKAGAISQGKARLDSIERFLQISNQFQQVLQATERDESALLETRIEQNNRSASEAITSNLLGAIAALFMILGAVYALRRSLQQSNRLNQKLAESEQQTKTLLEAVPVPVVIVNHEGKFYHANKAAGQLIKNVADFSAYGDTSQPELFFRFPGGEPYPLEERPTYRALQGEVAQVDDIELRQDGKAVQLQSSASPVYDPQGNLQYVITSSIDISDRVQSHVRLQEARQIAEKAAKLKQDFLANMSHEIRTPLNAMLGFSELLESTSLDKDQEEFVRLIRTAGKNLLTIVNDILDISKIEASMIQLESIPFSIQLLTASIKSMCQGAAAEKGLELRIDIEPELPTVFMGDPTRLTQILLNLINNAIKFTKQGHVSLTVKQGVATQSDWLPICFIVEDTGIGMAAKSLPTIFERFQQADNFTTRYYGGTGLGLNIVKSLTELQGGTVSVSSTLGIGSRFTVQIPYKLAKEQISFQQSLSLAATAGEEKVRVLVVEDNLMNQKLVLQVLKRLGYQAQVADDGLKALSMLKDASFDIILMDLQMPVMDGYETTRHIRSGLSKTVPIIAMTAHALPSEKEECLKAGMNEFLSKPFQIEELQRLIRAFLPNKGLAANGAASVTPDASPQPAQRFSPEPIFKMVGNNVEAVIELLQTYLKEAPGDMEALEQAIHQQNLEAIARLLHVQKVHTKMFGLSEATRLVLEAETQIRAGKTLADVDLLLEQYRKEVKEVLLIIDQYIQSNRPAA